MSGARNHCNAALSHRLYERMKSLFPNQTNDIIAASVLLSNTYSSVGEHQQAEAVRANRVRQFGKRVKVGRSWTEVDDELVVTSILEGHRLVRKNRSFRCRSSEHTVVRIRYRLGSILCWITFRRQLKEHGHQFDSSWVTRPLREGESIEAALCGHSEKLAIAFNFLRRPNTTFIQVTKNLRVCGDCRKCPWMGVAEMFSDPLFVG